LGSGKVVAVGVVVAVAVGSWGTLSPRILGLANLFFWRDSLIL